MNKIKPFNNDNTDNNGPLASDADFNGYLTNGRNGVARNGHQNPKQRKVYLILLSTSVVTALTGFALVVYWMFTHRKETGISLDSASGLSNLHPILMYLFMFGMNLYAVLIYRTHYNAQKSTLKWTHALLAMANITFSLSGVFAMFKSHQMLGMANFYSLHSWIGVTTNGLYFSQLLAGVFAFLRPTTSLQVRTKLMPWHRFAGSAILIMATLAVVTGISELVIFQDIGVYVYSKFTPITFIANLAAISTIISTAIAIFLLASPIYMRQEIVPTRLD